MAGQSTTTQTAPPAACPRAGGGPDRPVQPGLPARLVPDRPWLGAGFPGSPRRPGPAPASVARSRARRARGLRAVLPAQLQRPSGDPVAARPRRRGSQAPTGRRGGRRGLRPRGLHAANGRGIPASTFVGSDYHAGPIATARQRAASAGVGDRVRFEVAPAASFPGRHYDLMTMFDCRTDRGDLCPAACCLPRRAARQA
jgi:hypothetical protein